MKALIFIAAIAVLLAGCQTRAVIADLEEDKVIVQATGNDMSVIRAKAREGCAIHNRYPVEISFNCLDGYCMQKNYLFACKAYGDESD